MLTEGGVRRLAGTLLLLSFVLFLGHVVTLLALGPGRTTIVFVLAYGFPIGLAGVALYSVFHTHEPTLAAFGAFGFGAHGIMVVITAALLLAGLGFPDEFVLFGGEASNVTGAGGSLELSMDRIRSSAFAFLGLGLLPIGFLIVWTGVVGRWIGWLAVAAGLLGFLGMLAILARVLVGRPAGTSIQLIALLTFGFLLALGVRLVTRDVIEPSSGNGWFGGDPTT